MSTHTCQNCTVYIVCSSIIMGWLFYGEHLAEGHPLEVQFDCRSHHSEGESILKGDRSVHMLVGALVKTFFFEFWIWNILEYFSTTNQMV